MWIRPVCAMCLLLQFQNYIRWWLREQKYDFAWNVFCEFERRANAHTPQSRTCQMLRLIRKHIQALEWKRMATGQLPLRIQDTRKQYSVCRFACCLFVCCFDCFSFKKGKNLCRQPFCIQPKKKSLNSINKILVNFTQSAEKHCPSNGTLDQN